MAVTYTTIQFGKLFKIWY